MSGARGAPGTSGNGCGTTGRLVGIVVVRVGMAKLAGRPYVSDVSGDHAVRTVGLSDMLLFPMGDYPKASASNWID